MAGPTAKKRSHTDSTSRSKTQGPPNKRAKKQRKYHSDSDEPEAGQNGDFRPVNLLDSDNEDLDHAVVDDAGSSEEAESDSDADMGQSSGRKALGKTKKAQRAAKPSRLATDAPADADEENEADGAGDGDSYDEEELGSDDDDEEEEDEAAGAGEGGLRKPRSKRNDPSAFATSMSKILSTKLSTSRRADPMLSRSADAQQASRAALDSALESKARRQVRQQRALAMDKGRVRDVLVASSAAAVDDEEGAEGVMTTTAEIMETERRLRKVAQRGVVKLFNAVRAAQVKGQTAEREARRDGFVGVKGREEKVTEMSRKGFLDLIASGGGGLKKGGLEEA